MNRHLSKVLKGLGLILMCLVVVEVTLRMTTPYPLMRERPGKIYDQTVGYRLNPHHPETNSEGYRAMQGLPGERVVAAVGDGLTYGGGVKPWQSWPARFEQLSGVPTSSYGIGSYGVYNYYAVSRRALARSHKYVIIAIQFKNDLASRGKNCAIDYNRSELWLDARKRLGLKLPTCKLSETWDTAEAPEFLQELYGKFRLALVDSLRCGFPTPKSKNLYCREAKAAKTWPNPSEISGAYAAPKPLAPRATGQRKPASSYFNKASLRILKRDFRHSDPRLPLTRNVMGDFEKLIADLAVAASKVGARIGVLIIPPTTQIIYEYSENKDIYERHEWMRKLAENEQRLEKWLTSYLTSKEISWETARPELLDGLASWDNGGPAIYRPYGGHPLPEGYNAYAHAALRLYRKMANKPD